LLCSFLSALASFDTHLVRLNTQNLSDTHTQLVCLDDRRTEVAEVRHVNAFRHITHGVTTRFAELDFLNDAPEYHRDFVIPFFVDFAHCCVKAQTSLHANDHKVKCIWQALEDIVLTPRNLAGKLHHRQVVTQCRRHTRPDDSAHEAPVRHKEKQEEGTTGQAQRQCNTLPKEGCGFHLARHACTVEFFTNIVNLVFWRKLDDEFRKPFVHRHDDTVLHTQRHFQFFQRCRQLAVTILRQTTLKGVFILAVAAKNHQPNQHRGPD
jgi:hypothetical protein